MAESPAHLDAAASALQRGDPLTALRLTEGAAAPLALAIRGVALAQLEELAAASSCLEEASRAAARAGDRTTAARAELALAEIDVTRRDLDAARRRLEENAAVLGADGANAGFLDALHARIDVLRGRPDEALARLDGARIDGPFGSAIVALARAEAHLARGAIEACEQLLAHAEREARAARHGFLLAEIDAGRSRLKAAAARGVLEGRELSLDVLELAAARARRDGTMVDGLTHRVRALGEQVSLAMRPLLFALLDRLAVAAPAPVPRDELVLVLGVRRPNEAHRATLRVEIGRLRALLPAPLGIVATGGGWRLDAPPPLLRILPLAGQPPSTVAALLSDGQAWRAEDVARALGTSPRSAQRHLAALRDAGLARAVGAGRTARWVLIESRGFTLLGQLSALWGVRGAEDRATDVARATATPELPLSSRRTTSPARRSP